MAAVIMEEAGSPLPTEQALRLARMTLSELFLDTDPDQGDFERLRDRLLLARLPIEELDRIYYEELAPVLYHNLETPAGEWSGFDPDWLEAEIGKRAQRPTSRMFPLLGKLQQYWATRTTRTAWCRLRLMLTEHRE